MKAVSSLHHLNCVNGFTRLVEHVHPNLVILFGQDADF